MTNTKYLTLFWGVSPFTAPSTGKFGRTSPSVRAMRGCIAFSGGGGARITLPKTPLTPFGAQDQSGIGGLWILSFGQAKESIAVAGPRTGIQNLSR